MPVPGSLVEKNGIPKNKAAHVLADADARVAHLDLHVVIGGASDGHAQTSAPRHRVAGVQAQVHDHLLEEARSEADARKLAAEVEFDLNLPAHQSRSGCGGTAGCVALTSMSSAAVDDGRLKSSSWRDPQVGAEVGRLTDFREHRRGCGRDRLSWRTSSIVAADDGEDVAQVSVGNGACEPAERVGLLGGLSVEVGRSTAADRSFSHHV